MKAIPLGSIAAVLLGMGMAGLLAQPTPHPVDTPAPPPPVVKRPARVWGRGDLYNRDDAQKINTGKGNVILRLTHEEMPPEFRTSGKDPLPLVNDDSRLTTEFATYNENTQIASAPGKVKLEDQYDILTGNTGTAYYKTRDARFRGDVVIVALPHDENKTAPADSTQRQFDSPITLTCQMVDYNWRTRIGLASEQLTVKQKDRVVTADHGVYDGKKETVVLEGNVVYKRPNGEEGKAVKATIYFTKGKEKFEAEKAVFQYPVDPADIDEETKPAPGAGAGKPPAPATTPPPTPGSNPPAPTKPETKPQ